MAPLAWMAGVFAPFCKQDNKSFTPCLTASSAGCNP